MLRRNKSGKVLSLVTPSHSLRSKGTGMLINSVRPVLRNELVGDTEYESGSTIFIFCSYGIAHISVNLLTLMGVALGFHETRLRRCSFHETLFRCCINLRRFFFTLESF